MPLDQYAFAADMHDARPFDESDPARSNLERFGTSPCSSRRLVSCVTEAPGNLAGGGTGRRATGTGIGTIPIGGPSEAVAEVASASGYGPFSRGTEPAAAGFRREARFA